MSRKRSRGRGPAYTPPTVRRSTDAEIATTEKAVPPALAARQGRGTQPTMVPITEAINAMTSALLNGGRPSQPLPTDPRNRNSFGPGDPLPISAIDDGRMDTGRPSPRTNEYQMMSNVQLVSERPLDWKVLRRAATDVDLIALCLDKRKEHIRPLKWGWVVSEQAIDDEIDGKGVKRAQRGAAREDVEADIRARLQHDITRLNSWWREPWKRMQYDTKQWWSLLLHEHLVTDAVAIYPEMTYGGDVTAFKIIDGSTIKPLRDIKGEIPEPPYPAYQQVLYGFPRGEYTASMAQTPEGLVIPNGYLPDQLFYYRKTVRTDSPYGQSAVERALIAARLWLNRQGWLISEYDDGTGPRTWLVPPADAATLLGEKFTPQKRREWQRAYNDEMAGNTAARQRTQIAPPGFEPHEMTSVDAMYKPEYDQFLVRLVAAHMGIAMPELNFTEPGGLGSTGYHEGQEDVQDRNGTQPSIDVIQGIITRLGRTYQRAPQELEYKIFGQDTDDQDAEDEVVDRKYRRGSITLNETRDRDGKPRYAFAEADMPMVVTERGVLFLEGSSELVQPGILVTPASAPEPLNAEGAAAEPDGSAAGQPPAAPAPAAAAPGAPAPQPGQNPKRKEVEKFRAWARHGGKGTFELRELTPAEAVGYRIDLDRVTFKAAGDTDPDPKDQPPDNQGDVTDWPGWQYDLDAAAYWAPRIADALTGAVDADRLARDWVAHLPTTGLTEPAGAPPPGSEPTSEPAPERQLPVPASPDEGPVFQAGEARYETVARQFVEREAEHVDAALTEVLTGVYSDGYAIGAASAVAVVEQAPIELETWVVGDTEAAELLATHFGDGSGLRTLLNQAGVTIRSIADTRLDELGRALARGALRGDSADTIAGDIRGILSAPFRAHMIATTELCRAVSAASVACYGRRGYDGKYWLTADDDRVCPHICEPNEDQGVIPLEEPFESGAPHPPGHPLCRCAPMPGRLTTKESDLR